MMNLRPIMTSKPKVDHTGRQINGEGRYKMKKTLLLLMILMFTLGGCVGITPKSHKPKELTAAEIEAEVVRLKAELTKIDEQLQTLSLGRYGSGFLEELIAQWGIDPGKVYFFGKAKAIIARIIEQVLKKKRNKMMAQLDRLVNGTHARL